MCFTLKVWRAQLKERRYECQSSEKGGMVTRTKGSARLKSRIDNINIDVA